MGFYIYGIFVGFMGISCAMISFVGLHSCTFWLWFVIFVIGFYGWGVKLTYGVLGWFWFCCCLCGFWVVLCWVCGCCVCWVIFGCWDGLFLFLDNWLWSSVLCFLGFCVLCLELFGCY